MQLALLRTADHGKGQATDLGRYGDDRVESGLRSSHRDCNYRDLLDLDILAEGPVIAIHQSDDVLAQMDEWNTRTHTNSGLVDRVRASSFDEAFSGAGNSAFPQRLGNAESFAHVWQFYLSGSPVHGPPSTQSRDLLPLPQSRRDNLEAARQLLAA